jgi:8-oxo-dGTP pyrophosphatase MutT (NUDIX family)
MFSVWTACRFPSVVLEFSGEVQPAAPAATAILVREASAGLEVLLLRRNDTLKHMPGIWVFPGGKVEPDDSGPDDMTRACAAACRELEEEAGISIAPAAMTPFSHWLTPTIVKRRFATWFFLARVPDTVTVSVDGQEIVDYQWWKPDEAVAAHHDGALPLTPPTLVSLHDIETLKKGASLEAAVSDREPPCFFPKVVREADHMVFLYPGDAAYDTGDLEQVGGVHRTTGAEGIFRYVPKSEGA